MKRIQAPCSSPRGDFAKTLHWLIKKTASPFDNKVKHNANKQGKGAARSNNERRSQKCFLRGGRCVRSRLTHGWQEVGSCSFLYSSNVLGVTLRQSACHCSNELEDRRSSPMLILRINLHQLVSTVLLFGVWVYIKCLLSKLKGSHQHRDLDYCQIILPCSGGGPRSPLATT